MPFKRYQNTSECGAADFNKILWKLEIFDVIWFRKLKNYEKSF